MKLFFRIGKCFKKAFCTANGTVLIQITMCTYKKCVKCRVFVCGFNFV